MYELEARGLDKEFWETLHRRQNDAGLRSRRHAERDVLRKHGLRWTPGK